MSLITVEPMQKQETPVVAVRWMNSGDLEQVLGIESSSYEFPLSKDDFLNLLKQRNVIGLVGTLAEEVVGYVLYELQKGKFYIHVLAVKPQHRRRSFGSQLIDGLKAKLTQQKRTEIEIYVRESSLDAHLFLKALDFKALEICRDWYSDQVRNEPVQTEDAYRFVHVLREIAAD